MREHPADLEACPRGACPNRPRSIISRLLWSESPSSAMCCCSAPGWRWTRSSPLYARRPTASRAGMARPSAWRWQRWKRRIGARSRPSGRCGAGGSWKSTNQPAWRVGVCGSTSAFFTTSPGVNYLDVRLRSLLRPALPPTAMADTHRAVRDDVRHALEAAITAAHRVMWLTGDDSLGQADVAADVAAALGLALHILEAQDVPAGHAEIEALATLWEREAHAARQHVAGQRRRRSVARRRRPLRRAVARPGPRQRQPAAAARTAQPALHGRQARPAPSRSACGKRRSATAHCGSMARSTASPANSS